MEKNILLFLDRKTEKLEDNIALGMKSYIGWKEITFKGLGLLSRKLANYLMDRNINKGDGIAILSESMPEYGAALFAATLAGAVAIPLDIKLTIYELTSILSDCKPKLMLVSSAFLDMALKLKETISSIEEIILIDDNGVNKDFASLYTIENKPDKKWRHRNLSTTAFIIYTSGTTGNPKGVEITYRNIMAQVDAISKSFSLGSNDRLLSILPLNHLFELTVGFMSFLSKGTSIYYSKSLKPKDLFSVMQEKHITFMIVVPAFLKLLESSIKNEIKQFSPFRRFLYKQFYMIAPFIKSNRIKKLMFRQIHKKFGGHFKGFISGGAPLDINVGKFFQNLGMNVFEGYGLSEASPVVSLNVEKATKIGSVGRPLFNVEAKIDPETSELLVRGDNIMKGYFNKPEITKEVITEDGWLKTGDIAKIDKDGFIWITGRIKNMIVLAGGKKVFPEEVEAVLETSPLFQEVCVFGAIRNKGQKEGCEDVCVAVVPKDNVLEQYKDDKELNDVIKKEVKELSQRLSHFKRPTSVIVSRNRFERTATQKIKRKEVKKLFVG